MQHIIFISEMVGTIHADGATAQVCATADAKYEPAVEKASVTLTSFARHISGSRNGEHEPAWLPSSENVGEHLAQNEAADFAKDVFATWVKKVRDSIPHDLLA